MPEFALTILGDHVPKGRPRVSRRTGVAYTPAKTRRYEDVVRQQAAVAWAGRPLIPRGTAITMRLVSFRAIPKSMPKRDRVLVARGELFPTTKPDLSNLVKSVEDGLNSVVYEDDSCIVERVESKRYDVVPRVELLLRW